jgi:hypothetical protein
MLATTLSEEGQILLPPKFRHILSFNPVEAQYQKGLA